METLITDFGSVDFPEITGIKGDLNTEDVDQLTQSEQIVRKMKLENDELENANSFRKDLVKWMKAVVIYWLAFTAFILLVVLIANKGLLPSEVIVALLSTTTLDIIGLAVIVLTGLFKKREK